MKLLRFKKSPQLVPDNISFKHLLIKTIYLSIPFFFIIGISISTYYHFQSHVIENNISQINKYIINHLHLSQSKIFHNIKGDARLMANHPLIPAVLKNHRGPDADLMMRLWIEIATEKRSYDQMRLLDLRGNEIIRVNLTDNGAVSIPPDQLQNKGTRYYFKEAMQLEPGQVYFSPFDLNIEHDAIEQPIKPMLRVAVPVKNASGEKAGLIILNYLAVNILNDINVHSLVADTNLLLLNEDGYFIKGFKPEDEWRFMYPDKNQKQGLFEWRYKRLWNSIKTSVNGQIRDTSGLVTYQWFSTGDDNARPGIYDRRFLLISVVESQQIAALLSPYFNSSMGIVILSFPIIFIMSGLATRFRLRELNSVKRLRSAELHHRSILESLGEGILSVDLNGNITFANIRAADLTGFGENEMLGLPAHNVIHNNKFIENHNLSDCPIHTNLIKYQRFTDNDQFIKKSGELFPVQYITNRIENDGLLSGGVISFIDVSDQKKAEKHIEHLSLYDPLTDLPNKNLLIEKLNLLINTAERNQQVGAVLYIDVDRFKQVNDAIGHNHGDEILLEISNRLRKITKKSDVIARIGSDEFVILVTHDFNTSDEAGNVAQLLADEVMGIFEPPFHENEDPIHLTASIGITTYPAPESDAIRILAQADTAAENAKKAGRNTTRYFTSEMESHIKEWHSIHNRLVYALNNNAFSVVYQPKVDKNGSIIGLEALIRWTDGVLGIVSPAIFVPVAEQSGLILQLDNFVLSTVCNQIKELLGLGFEKMFGHIAVNISSEHFIDKDFVSLVKTEIKKAGIPAHTLELEITERTLIDNITDTREKVMALKEIGVRFSIDDFGTGYSSLSYLQQLPINRLKIDKAFVTNVFEHPDRQAIVRAIIMLAKSLSIEVIAEGVETIEELDFLLSAGCNEFQGYHFYRPMLYSDLSEIFHNMVELNRS